MTVAAFVTAAAQPPAPSRTADDVIEFVASYGAGHKSWMVPRLRERADVVVLDTGRFLDAAGVPE